MMRKAESTGKSVELMSSRSTSRLCSHCGSFVRKSLSVRMQRCRECGIVMDRELNKAINIQDRSGWGPPDAPVELETVSKREAPLSRER